uniref:14.2 kDa salivary protein n=1 Tax=Phlebotomus duboscqi TaxID=37738 RepID=Q06K49_PHLDU|nr:14.2 kDa salivary protein [Phlebotomus duboscqi]ABI20174.1 14.2 kDa salivary protein [Phlebotomus duboscqi]
MKYLVVSLFLAVCFIGLCQAGIPSKKCREDHLAGKLKEECILYCEYEAYRFTNLKYDIKPKHINNFLTVLTTGKVVNSTNRKEFEKMFNDCAKKAKAKHTTPNCERINYYYTCIIYETKDDLIISGKFQDAIDAYDKTVNI